MRTIKQGGTCSSNEYQQFWIVFTCNWRTNNFLSNFHLIPFFIRLITFIVIIIVPFSCNSFSCNFYPVSEHCVVNEEPFEINPEEMKIFWLKIAGTGS